MILMTYISQKRFFFFFILCILLTVSVGCSGKKERGPHTIREFRGGFSKTFGDLNAVHLEAARSINSTIFADEEEADSHRNMTKIKENDYYSVDKLTHSLPYLTKEAADLLETIGENFQDSLESKSATPYRIIVTSVLRTEKSVKSLRKRNSNSSLNSAHLYGTTFDVAYTRFDQLEEGEEIQPQLLKSVLAEVLRDLRKDKRCYVKYEVKQGCFHITARP